jgi:hypothetical protein
MWNANGKAPHAHIFLSLKSPAFILRAFSLSERLCRRDVQVGRNRARKTQIQRLLAMLWVTLNETSRILKNNMRTVLITAATSTDIPIILCNLEAGEYVSILPAAHKYTLN